MSRLARFTQKIFASAGLVGTLGFGGAAAGDTTTELATSSSLSTLQSLSRWVNGWSTATLGGTKFPAIEDMNALAYVTTSQLAYLLQQGIAEYDAGTTYFQKNVCMKAGTYQIYGSVTDNNIGNALTDPANWQLLIDLSAISTNLFTGGTTTGSANAQVLASTNPAVTAYTNGQAIVCTAGFTNSGSATLNVSSEGALTIKKDSGSGLIVLVGGEIIAGDTVFFTKNTAGTCWVLTSGFPLGSLAYKNVTNPTRQIFTSGSGTYTTPAGCLYISVRMVGGGGGGGGAGSGAGAGGAGVTTSFGSFTAVGGGAGSTSTGLISGGAGGTGGTGSAIRFSGQDGSSAYVNGAITSVGSGGSSLLGGGGAQTGAQSSNGIAAKGNTGGGGSGASSSGVVATGSSGGGGEYAEFRTTSPSATYSYVVGTGGSAGAGAQTGGAGADGVIIVDEFYY